MRKSEELHGENNFIKTEIHLNLQNRLFRPESLSFGTFLCVFGHPQMKIDLFFVSLFSPVKKQPIVTSHRAGHN